MSQMGLLFRGNYTEAEWLAAGEQEREARLKEEQAAEADLLGISVEELAYRETSQCEHAAMMSMLDAKDRDKEAYFYRIVRSCELACPKCGSTVFVDPPGKEFDIDICVKCGGRWETRDLDEENRDEENDEIEWSEVADRIGEDGPSAEDLS